MKKNDKFGVLFSWPVIIATLILFWPLGLVLLFVKIVRDKRAATLAYKLLNLIGVVALAFSALALILLVTDFHLSVFCFVLFIIGAGIALLVSAKKIKNNSELVKKYIAIIVNDGVCELDTISAITGKSFDEVKADISKLIDKGYLKNVYINEDTREVVLTKKKTQAATATDVFLGNNQPKSTVARLITCSCCGANNTVTSDNAECDYCGSVL